VGRETEEVGGVSDSDSDEGSAERELERDDMGDGWGDVTGEKKAGEGGGETMSSLVVRRSPFNNAEQWVKKRNGSPDSRLKSRR